MPKKTKKQKKMAEIHRLSLFQPPLSQVLVKSQNKSTEVPAITQSSHSFTFGVKADAKPRTAVNMEDYSFVRGDLVRITIFSLFALIFQGMLYFLLHRG